MLAKFHPSDGAGVDFIGTIGKTQCPLMRVILRQPEIIGNAAAAMRLNRVIDDF